jgi:hypothetical protein
MLYSTATFSGAVAVALSNGARRFRHVAVAFENFFRGDVGFLLEDWVIEEGCDIFG